MLRTLSYILPDQYFQRLRDENIPLFKNFLTAIHLVAHDSLQGVCLQTGGKVNRPLFERFLTNEISDLSSITVFTLGPSKQPAKNVHPRYDDRGLNFYYAQEDFLIRGTRKGTCHTISAQTPSSDSHLLVIHSGGASHPTA